MGGSINNALICATVLLKQEYDAHMKYCGNVHFCFFVVMHESSTLAS